MQQCRMKWEIQSTRSRARICFRNSWTRWLEISLMTQISRIWVSSNESFMISFFSIKAVFRFRAQVDLFLIISLMIFLTFKSLNLENLGRIVKSLTLEKLLKRLLTFNSIKQIRWILKSSWGFKTLRNWERKNQKNFKFALIIRGFNKWFWIWYPTHWNSHRTEAQSLSKVNS